MPRTGSSELNIRLPHIAAGESGGAPTFGLTPASSDGTYRATLAWKVIQSFGGTDTNGQLALVEGGSRATQAQSGSAGVQLNGTVPAPVGDVAIRVQNIGAAAPVTPTLTALPP